MRAWWVGGVWGGVFLGGGHSRAGGTQDLPSAFQVHTRSIVTRKPNGRRSRDQEGGACWCCYSPWRLTDLRRVVDNDGVRHVAAERRQVLQRRVECGGGGGEKGQVCMRRRGQAAGGRQDKGGEELPRGLKAEAVHRHHHHHHKWQTASARRLAESVLPHRTAPTAAPSQAWGGGTSAGRTTPCTTTTATASRGAPLGSCRPR